VLVVDDNETNRRILEEWLSTWRMQATAVGGAAEGLAALTQACDAGSPFALVLLDARMPDTDGATLAKQICDRWGAAGPRLILLSSDDDVALSSRSRQNGVHAQLLKPVGQSELLEALSRVMNPEPTLLSQRAKWSRPLERSPALRVLVAEDNELNLALLRELSRRSGHHAQFARDGRTALKLALEGACDVMLLDLHMPELDGFEVVRRIRAHERGTGQHLPIIALTARSSAHDRELCLAVGADAFLSKPIEAATLWATVGRLLARRAVQTATNDEEGVLDARAVLRAFGGHASILDKLRIVLRRILPDHVSHIRDALRDGDFVRLREAAHHLVGTVGAFSTVTAEVAATLEDAAVRHERESCALLVDRVESLCEALLVATATLSLESLSSRAGPELGYWE
jgi:two-component system, sensor histidine kinase and response regulator